MQNGSVYSLGSVGSPIQYHPDGNIRFAADNVNGSWTYAYDDFSRLVSAAKGGGATYTFDYDRFGNRWHENVNGSAQSSLTFDGKNHITNGGFSYDPGGSGDIVSDGFNSYTWDAENRLSAVNATAASYTYDALGWRVQKTTGASSVQYLFDTAGNMIAELNGSTLNRAEIYLGNAHLGTYTSGNTYFSHTDLLGSERARTLNTTPGTASQTCTGLPFGESQSCIGTESSPLHFSGLQRDSESSLDQTWFRKYSSAQGRWMTPDPLAASASVEDPQSFNGYAYVVDDPADLLDPLGLKWLWGCTSVNNGADHCDFTWVPDPSDFLWDDNRWNNCLIRPWCEPHGNNHPRPNPPKKNSPGWWRMFATEFLKFSGGPGNVPTCAEQALLHIVGEFIPISPSGATVIQATAPAAQAMAINRSVAQTQAQIDAYIAARRLTVPLRSSVVRSMATKGAESAVAAGSKANLAVQTLAVDYASVKSMLTTMDQARDGTCAAALPIF